MASVRWCLPGLASLVFVASVASAQPAVQSVVSTVPASPAVASSISVAISAGAVQSLGNVTDNVVNDFPTPVTITLAWELHPSTAHVRVIGYFANPASAMAGGPVAIPSSWIKGRVLTADVAGAPTTFTPFTQSAIGGVGSAGGSLSLMTQLILGYSKTGSRTIDLELQLDLVGRVLTPGNYTGILNIRAVTQ
ncbi:MAG TPA: hypothetical protein VFZ21_04900 [Gemmatimonadaceae bacterium]|jgi:hypothetical protein|nr:hypothetical protein [Gemmatimonadaceae bacterium]